MSAEWPDGLIPTWADFLSRPRGLDDLFASQLQFPLQRRREAEAMLAFAARTNPRVVMEVGADKGGGPWMWCHALPTLRRFAGIEVRGCPYASMLTDAFPAVDFCWQGASSYDPTTVAAVRSWLGNDRLDVLFLDGDKGRYADDFALYAPLVRKGGVVFLHDVRDGGPKEAFADIIRSRRWELILDVSEVGPALARERAGVPPSCPHEAWLRYWRGRSCSVGVVYID